MAYTPQNLSVFIASFSGTMAGMGASGRIPLDVLPDSYAGLASVAGAFAQSFDTARGPSPATTLELELTQELCESIWQERAPQAVEPLVEPDTYTDECLALLAMISASMVYFAGEGIPSPLADSQAVDTDLTIMATTDSSGTDVYTERGQSQININLYPAAVGSLVREVRFAVTLKNAVHSALYFARAHLLDLTNSVEVTGTVLSNSAEVNRGISKEFLSAPLTVGSSDGDIRSDTPTLYSVEFSGVGITDSVNERAILSGAKLQIRYV